jgi:hypothetical protein
LNLAPTSASLRSGGSATITATIVPLNAFAGTVNFSCQVATTLGNVTCAAGKSVIASGTSTLTITAPATSSTVPLLWRGSSPAWPLFLIGLTALLGSFVLIRGTARKPRTIALAGILLGAVLITGSCDDGDSERTGSVTVTAASGSVQHSATVSVTVD